jgi:hypothetical protein
MLSDKQVQLTDDYPVVKKPKMKTVEHHENTFSSSYKMEAAQRE